MIITLTLILIYKNDRENQIGNREWPYRDPGNTGHTRYKMKTNKTQKHNTEN